MIYIDLHTHHPSGRPGVLEIENFYFGQQKSPESPLRSVGLHPWYLENFDLETARHWLLEQAVLPETAAIGEAGLDKAVKTLWDLQTAAFECCIGVSEATHKPLIIHCVRAFGEIIKYKTQKHPQQAWILHGFDKHPQTAQSLLDAGFYLSFGAALFKTNSSAAAALRLAPAHRFFLETDVAQQISIEAVYEKAAALRGMSLEDLMGCVRENYRTCNF